MTTLNRIRTVWTGVAGTPWYTNLYFDGSGGNEQAQVDLVDAFWETLKAQFDTRLTATVEGTVTQIDSTTGLASGVFGGVDKATDLTGTGSVLPPANQGLAHLFTGVYIGGRQLRGRLFFPGLVVGAAAATGAVDSGYVTSWNTEVGDLIADSNAIGNLQVYSPTHHVTHDVVSVSASTEFAVIRSRRD